MADLQTTRHGSPELDADADKLLAMGADPGLTVADLISDLREQGRVARLTIGHFLKEGERLPCEQAADEIEEQRLVIDGLQSVINRAKAEGKL